MEIDMRNKKYPVHPLLFQILRGELAVADVTEIKCGDEPVDGTLRQHWDGTAIDDIRAEAATMMPLIRRAVESSPCIAVTETDAWTNDILVGNEDAALGLIIPLFINLRYLVPPLTGSRFETVIRRIAIATGTETSRTPSSIDPQALGKLVLVSFGCENGESGQDFNSVAMYAALPAVRRLYIPRARSYNRDGDFDGWPADLPLSRAHEVYFEESTVIPADARAFARGFAGPCVFWQWWQECGGHTPRHNPPVEWDYYGLGGGGTRAEAAEGEEYSGIEPGSRKEVLELRYPDFHEDYEHFNSWAWTKTEPSAEYPDQMKAMLDGSLLNWKDLVDQSL